MTNEMKRLKQHYLSSKGKTNHPPYMAKIRRILELEGEINTNDNDIEE